MQVEVSSAQRNLDVTTLRLQSRKWQGSGAAASSPPPPAWRRLMRRHLLQIRGCVIVLQLLFPHLRASGLVASCTPAFVTAAFHSAG
jgi:hypothetical protein